MKEEEWNKEKLNQDPESRIHRNIASGGLMGLFIPIRASVASALAPVQVL